MSSLYSSPHSTGDDAMNSHQIRDAWIKKQMEKRVDEFTEEKLLHIFLGTWNVNAKYNDEELDEWLRPKSLKGVQPDVYGIGLQEIVDLNAASFVGVPKTAEPWSIRFGLCLGDAYVHICTKPLVGILLCVFVRKQHFAHVKNVMIDTAGVGVMGVGGNKGGVGIRFGLYDSSVCIVNSHLAAHKNNIQGRNANFRDISERLRFTVPSEKRHLSRSFDILSHDFLFWIGDLNYRLTLTELEMVYERIAERDWSFLLSHDQLLLEKASGHAFNGYREGRIAFAPTYKYQTRTNVYEKRADKKVRFPAWCDRILWTCSNTQTLMETKQIFYERAEMTMSDHKPVMSLLQIKVKVLMKEKQNVIYQSLVRQIDAWENEQMPKLAMSTTSMHFADVQYGRSQHQTLRLVNDGSVIAQFRFIPKLQDNDISKPWLTIEPEFGIIPPQETMEVKVRVCVKQQSAFGLNTSKESLDDILVIRLQHGRDYFMTISGTWTKTCLGSSLEFLVLLPGPARHSTLDPSKDEPSSVMSVPKELWRIVDYVYKHGMNAKDIFVTCGEQTEINCIIEQLDLNEEFRHYAVCSMADVLIRFLDAMPQPMIPFELCKQFTQASDPTAFCQTMFLELSQVHYNSLIFVIAFLRELLERREENELSAETLALIFAQAFTHASVRVDEPSMNPALALLYHCLTSIEFV